MLIFWLILLILLVVSEALTTQLLTIWFAVGALGGLLAQCFGAPVWLQWVVFTAISLICLALTRPLVKRLTQRRPVPTNVDRLLGSTALVTESIDNTRGLGSVTVSGIPWSARSENGDCIESGSTVIVKRIEGVKLLVAKKETEE